MWRFLLLVACLAPAIHGFDFFNCSQVKLCNQLRNHNIEKRDHYSADIEKHTVDQNNVLHIPLSNINGTKPLSLKISLLPGSKARVIIEETDSSPKRYELKDVIQKQPSAMEIDMDNSTAGILEVTPKDKNHLYKVIIYASPPFRVEFWYYNQKNVVFDARNLLMNNLKSDQNQWYTFKLQFSSVKRLFGLSYHADNLTLIDTAETDPYRMKNNDAWGHKAFKTSSLYGSIPVIYGHIKDRTYGVFLHNAAEQWIDISYYPTAQLAEAYFMVDRGALDLYVLFGPKPDSVFKQLTSLVGKAHMPQIWTLGYHQCRFSYKSEDDVVDVVTKMDENNFPFDAIWLDGDHANYSKWFQWNETTYKHPVELQKVIQDTGRVCVSISDPHIKVDDNYAVYAGAKDKYFIKYQGKDYQDDCWPGKSSWIDYLNPEARDYYASWYGFDKFNGSTPVLAGIWNDMNEPAVFNEPLEKTAPTDALHYGNVTHGDIHNIYGLLMTMATHDGLMKRDRGKKRPFVLTRSHFAGSQRYAAMWTGDNTATWEHLRIVYPQCMISNIAGMVFCGSDIGGFIGNPPEELLQRWYQAAVWTPFFRGHSSRESNRREPYLNEKIADSLRETIRFRYKHIPMFYTAFYEYITNESPIIRPLFYNYPSIEQPYDNQLILGKDILAAAVTFEGLKTIDVYLPTTDIWYRIDDDSWKKYGGGIHSVNLTMDTSPVFYRGGSIIVRQDDPVRHTGEMKNLAYTMYVNLDAENKASGNFYMDDFVSFNYQNNNNYFYVQLDYTHSTGLNISVISGDSTGLAPQMHNIVIHSSPDNGLTESRTLKYNKNRHDQNLKDIDIAAELGKSGTYFIPL